MQAIIPKTKPPNLTAAYPLFLLIVRSAILISLFNIMVDSVVNERIVEMRKLRSTFHVYCLLAVRAPNFRTSL